MIPSRLSKSGRGLAGAAFAFTVLCTSAVLLAERVPAQPGPAEAAALSTATVTDTAPTDPFGSEPKTTVTPAPGPSPATTAPASTPTSVAASTATTAPPTTVAPTTVAPTTVAPTTLAPTTTPPPTTTLPRPLPPPADPDASEPVVPLGRLALPSLGIDSPLYEGIRLPTFDLGPGHWPGSALPGQQGNMVVGGHRTSANADFRDLDRLAAGDQMIVTDTNGNTFIYVVDSTEITGPFSLRVINQTAATTATLFACHPPGQVIERIVVHLTLAA